MGIVARNFEAEDWAGITESFEDGLVGSRGLEFALEGVAVTVEENGSVMACGGVTPNGELWLRLSRKCNMQAALEAVKIGVEKLQKSFEDVQLWCRVRIGWRQGERFVQWLGMHKINVEGEYGIWH